MTRESEVVTYLRTDDALDDLAPGGVYPDADLSEIGLTDAVAMPDVWAGGVFQTTVVVRERAPVPTGDLQDVTLQHTSMSQAIEIWGYGLTAEAIEAALNRVYALLMGHKLTVGWRATWAGGAPLMQAPELPSGIFVRMESYRVVAVRKPVAV